MKLVLLRRKGYRLPASLPCSLLESSVSPGELSLSLSLSLSLCSHMMCVVYLLGTRRAIPPQLHASHTVAELPVSLPHPPLANISQQSEPELLTASSSLVERAEPAVATIISLEDEDRSQQAQSSTEGEAEPLQANVRRARSLKHFTPPPPHTSPPPSPFSPPAASSETALIISPSPKVWYTAHAVHVV